MRTLDGIALIVFFVGIAAAQEPPKVFARLDCTKTEGQKSLSIRSSPDEASETVVVLPCGSDVLVLARQNEDWAKVRTGEEREGYVQVRYLHPLTANSLTPIVPPKILVATDPNYSDEARKKGIEGSVQVAFILGKDGEPHDVIVKRSLGHGLDGEAVNAVKKWRFQPATRDGKPVETKMQVEVSFRLYNKRR
jgi:TonB family protein